MLNFYTDEALLRPITLATPKLFCIPLEGGTSTSRLYLGDGYTASVMAPVLSTNTTIALDQADEFLAGGGTATISGVSFSYTGKTNNSLTGVTGLVDGFAVGTKVKPILNYVTLGNIIVYITGGDAIGPASQLAVTVKPSYQANFGFRGTPAIFNVESLSSEASLAVDINITALPGTDFNFTSIGLLFGGYVARSGSDATPPGNTDNTGSISALIQVDRHNQGLVLMERLFPLNRQVAPNLPGFTVDEYRWRDSTMVNAQAVIPTNWNIDLSKIPPTSFVSGIADQSDLTPLVVEEFQNSLYLRIQDGFYFEGKVRSYLPAGSRMEIFPTTLAAQTFTLQQCPSMQTPIFVGNWVANQSGQFVKGSEYRYVGHQFDTTTNDNQFTIQRNAGRLTLKGSMPQQKILLGIVSGDPIDFFDIPTFPVYNIPQVYIDRGPNLPHLTATTFTFDQEDGTLQVPSIPGAIMGEPIFAVCNPAVAVLYAQDFPWQPKRGYSAGTCVTFNGFIFRAANTANSLAMIPPFIMSPDAITPDGGLQWVCEGPVNTVRALADLNPAFAGISQGFLYLAQNFQGAYTITLSCDKPRIAVPPTVIGQLGLIAFGPVYFDGDYALLIATVLDSNKNPISNVELEVVPGPEFDGTVNYQDPTITPITVRTGGDGVANMIYTPRSGFGFYLPLTNVSMTHVAGDTIQLAEPIALSQLWNSVEGWLATLYQVRADNPYYGMLDANTAAGQILFATSGTPGTTSYKTNGRRVPLLTSAGTALLPIEARDSLGNLTTATGFNGLVSTLTYGKTVVGDSLVMAYFISYIERVTLRVAATNSNVKSNSILLQMAPPPLIADQTPYLLLDNLTSGILDQQRLAFFGATIYFPGSALL
jgi:hypothetical protein